MTANRILTTHVGSLVRPDDFKEVLRRKVDNAIGQEEFDTALASAVDWVVRKQVETGIDVVSDGEYGKIGGWEQYVLDRLTGFGEALGDAGTTEVATGDMGRFADFYKEFWPTQDHPEAIYPCRGDIEYVGFDELERDIGNIKSAMVKAGAEHGFLPVAAPASAFALSPNEHYATEQEYIEAGAKALREEYKAITDAGLFVQVDDAHLPFMWDRIVSNGTREDYFAWARPRIDALKEALRGIPEEQVRYHICWGSWNGPHASDVELKEIIGLLLELPVGAYCVESANPRHEHEWKVWGEVELPEGRKVIPGVISHQTNVVEHPELVAERLLRFASVVGGENVMAGSDCGFAQGPFIARVHPSIMWAKLEALVEGARIASAELWK